MKGSNMTKASGTVIHRDRTFEYNGDVYGVHKQAPRASGDNVYLVYRVRDGREVPAESFDSLAEVRAWVDESRANGWPIIEDN